MPFRLAGQLRGRTLRLPLVSGVNRLGSSSECEVRLDDPTVSRHHAELVVDDDGGVTLRDLASRNGTFIGGRRVSSELVYPGTTLTFGQVHLDLESVSAADLVAGVSLGAPPAPEESEAGSEFSTVRTKPAESFALERLPKLLALLEEGGDRTQLAQAGGAALFESLPVLAVAITSGEPAGVLFSAHRDIDGVSGAPIEVGDAALRVRVTFADSAAVPAFRPLVDVLAALVRLADREPGLAAPARTGTSSAKPPDPPSVAPDVLRLYAEAARVARGDVGVLVTGESGTGKEVLARFLHAASRRADGPFIALNCAALPRDLLETELFGIERGVATGVEARPGRFELAHGGTLFLDEIGDMALETQAKILRVLQEGSVHRIGGSVAKKAEVRIVAATNRDMRALLASRQFREDLYYRIATWRVELPALRRRRADIPNLAAFFLSRAAARHGVRVRGISQAALDRLVAYDWPGNIRQLENEMARVVLFLADGDLLDTGVLGFETTAVDAPLPTRLSEILEHAERSAIAAALESTAGDVEKAADRLGTARSTLYRRIKALGLGGEDASE